MASREKPDCLKIAITKIYSEYDPSALITTDHLYGVIAMTGTLLRVGDNNEIYSAIADKWKIENNNTIFKLKISDQARFSDGSPIRSQDVLLSLKRHLLFVGTHIEFKKKILGAEEIKSVEDEVRGLKVEDGWLRIELTHPDERFLFWLAFPELPILPEQEARKSVGRIDYQVTSGPYRHDGPLTGDELRLRANPHFYEKVSEAAQCVRVRGVDSPEQLYELLEKEQIDVADYGAALAPQFEKLTQGNRYNFVSGETVSLLYFVFNNRSAIFREREQRRWFGQSVRAESFIPYAKDKLFFTADQFLTSIHQGFLTPKEAAEAIGSENSAAIGKTTPIRVLYPEIFGVSLMKLIQDNLEAQLGVKIEFVTYKEGEVLDALKKENWDVFFILVGMAEKATNILFSYHFRGSNPLYNFVDEEIQSQMKKIEMAKTDQERSDAYRVIGKRLLSEAYIKPLAYFRWPVILRSDLKIRNYNSMGFSKSPWRIEWVE